MTADLLRPIDGLKHVPVEAQFGWRVASEHAQDWLLAQRGNYWHCSLQTNLPMLPTLVVQSERNMNGQRNVRSAAAPCVTLALSFPYDSFSPGSAVHISLYARVEGHVWGTGLSVDEPILKTEPQRLTTIHLVENVALATGAAIHLADINGRERVSVSVVLIAKSDTEFLGHGGRWRIKRSLQVDLPANLGFLREGRWRTELQPRPKESLR